MNPDLTLNLMLGFLVLHNLVMARYNIDVRRARIRQHGTAAGAWALLSGLVILGLYVWLAVATGYWQFAAIPAVGLLITYGATIATRQSADA